MGIQQAYHGYCIQYTIYIYIYIYNEDVMYDKRRLCPEIRGAQK